MSSSSKFFSDFSELKLNLKIFVNFQRATLDKEHFDSSSLASSSPKLLWIGIGTKPIRDNHHLHSSLKTTSAPPKPERFSSANSLSQSVTLFYQDDFKHNHHHFSPFKQEGNVCKEGGGTVNF